MDLFQVLRTPDLTKHYPKKESMKIEGKSILLVSEKNKPPFVFLTLFSATRGYPRLYNYPQRYNPFVEKYFKNPTLGTHKKETIKGTKPQNTRKSHEIIQYTSIDTQTYS